MTAIAPDVVTPTETTLAAAALTIVDQAEKPLTPRALSRELQTGLQVSRQQVKAALAALMDQNLLSYSIACGRSVIVPSFARPVRLSPRVVIKPPRCTHSADADTVVIDLAPGAAFGGGQHATTRLALLAIDDLLHPTRRPAQLRQALDLGTGSGVLALALLKLGLHHVTGVDKDAIACHEARHNARLNHLDTRFNVLSGSADDVSGQFDLVTANLRYPTLCRLYPRICQWLRRPGGLVLSGIKTDEVQDVLQTYQPEFTLQQQYSGQGWSALAFTREKYRLSITDSVILDQGRSN